MNEEGLPIVIDNGSYSCKAGLSGDDAPRTHFPSVVGKSPHQNAIFAYNNDNKDWYVGQEALYKKYALSLQSPMSHGTTNKWDDMTKIWHHCFYNELRVTPSEHPCLLTQAPFNPKQDRERTTEIFFETFDVPYFYLASQPVLSLFSSGKSTGLVLQSGDCATHTVPIFQGYQLRHAIQRIQLGGRDLTHHLYKMLNSQINLNFQIYPHNYYYSYQFQAVRNIKQKHCYVALDYDQKFSSCLKGENQNKVYELADGHTISIGSQTFRCPQTLFKPEMIGKSVLGFHQMTYSSILKSDIDLRRDLFRNIVLSGGNTLFPGISERLHNEVEALAPLTTNVRVFAPQQRRFSTWIGGSILTSLSTFYPFWISKEEYYQNGSQIVHKKCF